MFKKIFAIAAICILHSPIVFAYAPYAGAGLDFRVNTNTTSNFRGLSPNLFLGYGGIFSQNIYIAGEGFYAPTTLAITNNPNSSSSLRTTYLYGVSIIPGILLADHSFGFARVGVVRTHFSSQNRTVTGGQVGLGLQTSVCPNWDIRGEYDYTFHRSFDSVRPPKTDEAKFGLIYKIE